MTFQTPSQYTPPSIGSLAVAMAKPRITEHAIQCARLLLGSYRKVDAESPEIFAGAIAAVLSRYPEDVASAVTDPATGLSTRSKYAPQPSEVRDACEAAMLPRYEAASRDAERRRIEAQLAERQQMDARRAGTDIERIQRVAAAFHRQAKAIADDAGETKRRLADLSRAEAEAKLARMQPISPDIPISPWLRAQLDRIIEDRAIPSDPNARHML